MKVHPIILIALIVVLPLGLLAWATRYIAFQEASVAKQRLQELMTQRLEEINESIARHFDRVTRELRQQTAIDDFGIDALREMNRLEPRFLQLFVMSPDGELVYPHPQHSLNRAESSFLTRTSKMFADQDLTTAVSLSDDSDGWVVWYWDRGENLIYWQRRPSEHIVGVALERARWIADLIAELPETRVSSDSATQRQAFESGLRLVDASSAAVYQWGTLSTDEEIVKPFCEIPVTSPLTAWRLQCMLPAASQPLALGKGMRLSLWLGLIGVGLALFTLAAMLLKGYTRDIREASQQVSFVNHVSHELKTPLTNIRMYAELLERDLKGWDDALGERPRQRLNTIIAESERLSRLIGNVLTFGRHRRKLLKPQPRAVIPDDCIRTIVERFRPALEALQLQMELDCKASQARMLDPDFLEQIPGNLISNVEKYAVEGGWIKIQCSEVDDRLRVVVEDHGPGVPIDQREMIFEPFKRLKNDVSSAAGTGIGLTIARELARLHGGDVRLIDSPSGCRFEVQLKCPRSLA